ncbi:hypothetical protein DFH09DRAFT_1102743 [Mycena vulgaris]|nr:hypothetical protein DFH09DRAFT_1102743 [Mycena vulgaris]
MFGVYCTRPPRKLNQLKHGIKKRQSARARQRPLYTRTFQRRQPDTAMAITVIPERPSPTRLLNQFDERHEFNPDFFPSVGKFLAQRVQPSLDAVYSTIGARVPLAEGPLPTRKLNQLKHGCGADSFSPEWNRNAAGPYRAVIMNKHVVPGPTTLSPQFRLKSYGDGRFHRSLRFQTLFAATPRQAADVPGSRSLFLLGCPNDVTPAIDVVWPVSPMFRRLRTALHVVTSKFKLRGEVPRPTALLPGDCIHTARSLTFGCLNTMGRRAGAGIIQKALGGRGTRTWRLAAMAVTQSAGNWGVVTALPSSRYQLKEQLSAPQCSLFLKHVCEPPHDPKSWSDWL